MLISTYIFLYLLALDFRHCLQVADNYPQAQASLCYKIFKETSPLHTLSLPVTSVCVWGGGGGGGGAEGGFATFWSNEHPFQPERNPYIATGMPLPWGHVTA